MENAKTSVHAFVTSKLDNYKALSSGTRKALVTRKALSSA